MILTETSRLDERVTELRMQHGMTGYGAYSWLVDMLYQNGGSMPCSYKSLAYDMHLDDGAELVRSVVEDFGLFVLADGQFASPEVTQLLKSAKAKKAADARWGAKEHVECEKKSAQEDEKPKAVQLSMFEEEVPPQPQKAPIAQPDNTEEAITEDKKKKRTEFTPPTIQEIEEYCRSEGIQLDADAFWHYYESQGWMVGKNKMKKWKSAIRTWQRNNYGNKRTTIIGANPISTGSIPKDQHFEDF